MPSLLLRGVEALSLGDIAASSGLAVCSNKAALFVDIDNHTTFVGFFHSQLSFQSELTFMLI